MPLSINVRLFGPTKPVYGNAGLTLTAAHPFGGIHDSDENGDGTVTAYVDLNRPEGVEDGSSIDLTGTLADFAELIDSLQQLVANMAEANPNLTVGES